MNHLIFIGFLAFFALGFVCALTMKRAKDEPYTLDPDYIAICAAIMRERRVKASAFYFDVFNAGMLAERSRNSK